MFDVVNLGAFRSGRRHVLTTTTSDMIDMLKLGFTSKACCWVHRRGQTQSILAMCALSLCCCGVVLVTLISPQNSGTTGGQGSA